MVPTPQVVPSPVAYPVRPRAPSDHRDDALGVGQPGQRNVSRTETARLLALIKRRLHERCCISWAGSSSVGIQITIRKPDADDVAFVWVPATKHYQQLWATQATKCSDASIRFIIPLRARPLMTAVAEALEHARAGGA
eukprot:4229673-Alexandrium_andersonii.AAC.1